MHNVTTAAIQRIIIVDATGLSDSVRGYLGGTTAQALLPFLTGVGLYWINVFWTAATVIVLMHAGSRKGIVHRWLLFMLILVLSLTTAYLTLYLASVIRQVRVLDYGLATRLLFVLQTAVGDSLTIWRCFVACGNRVDAIVVPIVSAFVHAASAMTVATGGSQCSGKLSPKSVIPSFFHQIWQYSRYFTWEGITGEVDRLLEGCFRILHLLSPESLYSYALNELEVSLCIWRQ